MVDPVLRFGPLERAAVFAALKRAKAKYGINHSGAALARALTEAFPDASV